MYHPSKKILKEYADVLVKFALNSGEGVKRGEVVYCMVPDIAKPMLLALQESLLEAGAHPILRLAPSGMEKPFYKLANDEQLMFFPKKYLRARVDLIDHSIGILADHDPLELTKIAPEKIIKRQKPKTTLRDWMFDKEYAGKLTWTIALYGTSAMAKEAGMTLKDYWQQIIRACFLDSKDPISRWGEIFKEQERVKKALNLIPIERIHIVGKNIDLWITLGEKRKWEGGSGRNIPSFEIFTSPDWRGTNGMIFFNQPLYRYLNLIENIRLEFKNGKVVKASSKKGGKLLHEILKRENANKIGEFSLTDSRFSRITKFMANTLYDENIGGKYGNMHIALGMSYKDAYDGDPRTVKKSEWKKMGFNQSGEHMDIITTRNRIVTAFLKDGTKRDIYKNGKFIV